MRMYRWRATIQVENPKRLRALKKNLKRSKRKTKTDTVYSLERSWVFLQCVIDKEWFHERDKQRKLRRQN
ncbi:hypothetical protein CN624_21325 [Bacillus toyonensis]|nr:hypothetical protein CN624_21325 [Bacillus toyonensis]